MGAKFSKKSTGLPAGFEKRIQIPFDRIELPVQLVKPRKNGVRLPDLQLMERLIE